MSTKDQLNTPLSLGVEQNNESANRHRDPNILRELYHGKGLTLSQVGDRLGVSTSTIAYQMGKHGIPTRQNAPEKPPSVRQLNGGYFIITSEYRGERDTVYIHKLTAVAKYGFEVVANADLVHHRNGYKFDNRPSNLEPLGISEHAKRHAEYDGTAEYI